MDGAIITGGLFGLTSLGILYYIGRSVAPVTKFLYANARIQARSNYLIQDKNIDAMISSKSLNDLTNMLRETDYIDELEKIKSKDDLKEFHKAVEKSFMESILELKKMSPENAKDLLDAYLMMLEAKVLKTIFRARFGNELLDEELVFPVGSITPDVLRHLLDTKTIADISVVMSTTKFSGLFTENYDNTEKFDVAIEGLVLNNLMEATGKSKMHDSQAIMEIINKKIDMMNLLALLKFRVRNLDKEKQLELLMHSESMLSKKLKDLVNADSLKKMVESCKNNEFHPALEASLAEYEKDNSLMHFELNLMREFIKTIKDNELAHSLGPYPLFAYIMKKEIEMRNLFTISSGIANGFEPERIRRLVI